MSRRSVLAPGIERCRVRAALMPLQANRRPCRQTDYAPPARAHNRRCRGTHADRSCRCRGELQHRRPPGRPPGARVLSRGGRRRPGATHDDGPDQPAARQGNPGHRASWTEDAVGARAARTTPPRAARARRRRRRLGCLLARVPADPVWPRSEGGRRPVHRCDRRCARAVPGEEATHCRRHRRQPHLPSTRRPDGLGGLVHAARRW